MTQQIDLAELAQYFVQSPVDNADAYEAYARLSQEKRPPFFGHNGIDNVLIPPRPGELTTILARPGHGKTTLLAYLARRMGQELINRGLTRQQLTLAESQDKDRPATPQIFFITGESATEEVGAYLAAAPGAPSPTDVARGDADLDKLHDALVDRMYAPITVIGPSIMHAAPMELRTQFTLELALDLVREQCKDKTIYPFAVFVDYIQVMPTAQYAKSDMITKVDRAAKATKELAQVLGCPVIATAQAGRDVDNTKDKIPQMHHAQWASAIEQVSDKILGIYRPIRDKAVGESVEVGKYQYSVVDSLLLVSLRKQRFAPGYGTWACAFDVDAQTMGEYEYREDVLNEWNGTRPASSGDWLDGSR